MYMNKSPFLKTIIIFPGLLLFCFLACTAQSIPVFNKYAIKGLAEKSSVNNIYQDKNGFLWFSGLSGLYRFDGNGLTRYQHNPNDSNSLSHNYVTSFCEDPYGNFLVGTFGGGIDYFQKSNGGGFKKNSDNRLVEMEAGVFITIVKSNYGNVAWCGTVRGTVLKYDFTTKQYERVFSIAPVASQGNRLDIRAIAEIDSNKLIIASVKGLYYVDAASKKSYHVGELSPQLKTLDTTAAYSLMTDHKQQLWIGCKGRIFIVDRKNFSILYEINDATDKNLQSTVVTALVQLKDGQVLLGTNKGIYA